MLFEYSTLFLCHSGLFRYHSGSFRYHSGSFRYHSGSFRYHSGSFRYHPPVRSIPVSFRFIPVSFRSIPVSFRFISGHSALFRSIPFLCFRGNAPINTGLAIPKDTGVNLPALSDQKRTQLRILLAELELIIIDEISMVSNTRLLNIHKILKEIFATTNSRLFAGISIISVGDLYQLPPIRQQPMAIFADYKNDAYNLWHPWHCFKMIELDEVMRQKGDVKFTELLNRCRTGSQTEDDIKCLQNRSVSL